MNLGECVCFAELVQLHECKLEQMGSWIYPGWWLIRLREGQGKIVIIHGHDYNDWSWNLNWVRRRMNLKKGEKRRWRTGQSSMDWRFKRSESQEVKAGEKIKTRLWLWKWIAEVGGGQRYWRSEVQGNEKWDGSGVLEGVPTGRWKSPRIKTGEWQWNRS